MLSRLKDVLNYLSVFFQDFLIYVGVSNIGEGFHGEPALKKCDEPLNRLSTPSSDHTKPDIKKMPFLEKIVAVIIFHMPLWQPL